MSTLTQASRLLREDRNNPAASPSPAKERARARPSPLVVRLVAIGAIGSCVALAFPSVGGLVAIYFGILIILAGIDWLGSRQDIAPELERILPPRMIKDRAATLVYRIERKVGPGTTVEILDELPAVLGGDLQIPTVKLKTGQMVETSRDVTPARRGTFPLGPTLLLWRSRLGFFRFRREVVSKVSAVVLPPASVPQRRAALDYRILREELGIKPRPLRGEGSEFESLREYVTGDDPRHIDWRASARHGRLHVRQYQTERRHTVVIALDTGRLMGALVDNVSKLDHAINCAAALARASVSFGDRVSIVAFDQKLRLFMRPRMGHAGAGALVESTSGLFPSSFEPDYRILLETLAIHQKKRALVVVLTDFVEGGASRDLEAHLAALARRHCVMLVALRDRMLREVDVCEPAISRDRIYLRLALQDLVAEREAALARIERFGAQVLDLDPSQVTAPVLNRYLAIREAALI